MATKHADNDSKTSDKSKQGGQGGEQAASGSSHGKSGSAAQKKGQSNSDKPGSSIIDLVVEDHVKVKELFKQLQTLSDEDGESVYQQLCWDVSLHAVTEELVMYPLQEKLGEEGKMMAQESRMDHEKTKGILRELDGKKLAHHGVREMLGSAIGALVEHINKEEENDLVYLREKLSEQELMNAGRDYQHCKSIIPDIAPSNQVGSEQQEDMSEEDSHFKTPMELLLSGKEKIQKILGLDSGAQGNNSSGGDKQGSKDEKDGNKSSSGGQGGKSSGQQGSTQSEGDSKSHGGQGGKSSGQQGSKSQSEGDSTPRGGQGHGGQGHGGQGGKSSGQQGSKTQSEGDGKSHGGQGGKSGSSTGQHGGKSGESDSKSSTGKDQEGQEEHVYDLRERDESGHVVHVDEHAHKDQAGQNDQGKHGGSQHDGRKSRNGDEDVEMASQGNKKGGKEAGDQDKNGGDHGSAKNGQGKREHEEGGEQASKKKATDSRGGQDKMEVDSGSH